MLKRVLGFGAGMFVAVALVVLVVAWPSEDAVTAAVIVGAIAAMTACSILVVVEMFAAQDRQRRP